MSQAAGALRATERAERARGSGGAAAASRWKAASRRALGFAAAGVALTGAAGVALTGDAVYQCKKSTETYRLIVLSVDDPNNRNNPNKAFAMELSWTQMVLLCNVRSDRSSVPQAVFNDTVWRQKSSCFGWRGVGATGVICAPHAGRVLVCLDGDPAQWRLVGVGAEEAQKCIPGVVETSDGPQKVPEVSAAMALTWLKVTLGARKNGPAPESGARDVRVRALSDGAGNWLKTRGEWPCTVDGYSLVCTSWRDGTTLTKETIPIAQIHVEMASSYRWFEGLFGFSDWPVGISGEEALEKNKSKFRYDQDTGVLSSELVREVWHAGRFTTPSLAELRRISPSRGSETSVRFVSGDVAILHGDLAYAGAVFLVSSNLDCLQHSHLATPALGVAGYAAETTQGAACAISCAPGTIVRNYFAHDTEVNTLRAVIESLSGGAGERQLAHVRNGSAYADDADLSALSTKIDGLSDDARESTKGLLRVGIQKDTEVTCAKLAADLKWYRVVREDPALRVTQVFAGLAGLSGLDTKWKSLTSLVFEAAYEATLCVAANARHDSRNSHTNTNQTVVLTALCGEDAPRWLAEAKATALGRALFKFKGAGLDVVIDEPRHDVYVYTKICEELVALGLVFRTPHFGHASAESYKAKLYTE